MPEYFSHDYNPTNDPKIVCLLGDYGGLGYGIFWRIIEMLHQEKTNKLPLKTYIFVAIAKQMLASAEQIQALLDDCIKKYELLQSDGEFFWSNRVFDNIEKRRETSLKRAIAGKKGAEAKYQNLAIAKQNLAKERKGKEIKENIKESSRFAPPSLEEQIKPIENQYAPSMITDFKLYWDEQDQKGTPRWKKEKTWQIELRLQKWKRNQEKWDYQKQKIKIEELPKRDIEKRTEGFTKLFNK